MEDTENITISIESTGPDSRIRIHATEFGTAGFVIQGGGDEYRYTIEIYEDDGGHSQIRITPVHGQ